MAGCLLLLVMLAGTAVAVVPATETATATPTQLLSRADSVKTGNFSEFVQLLDRLADEDSLLSPEERMHLRYLQAWKLGYQGDYKSATAQLNAIIAESDDPTLRFRARTTLVNMLSIGTHYEEAFMQVGQLLEQLPEISAKDARIQGLGEAALVSNEAGQYDLGLNFANQILQENPVGDGDCKGRYLLAQSLYGIGKFSIFEKQAADAIDACDKASELLYANSVRVLLARFDLQHGKSPAAINLLRKHYVEVRNTGYPELMADFDASLARAYWNEGKIALAKQYADAAVADGLKNEFTKASTSANELLYLIAKKQGDMANALAYHEQFMAADKGYLNTLSAKALAYQAVKQQVLAKKLQVDTLARQNKILQLQQALSKKAMEASRLWILLLLLLLACIGLITYRIKRSQLRFMKLARRDGLTGIFNRQHFVNEAERQLHYCSKSARDVCLVLIDLDHFKLVNDTHGHAVGDRVLKRAVAACQAHLRSTDLFGRLGGEEFGIVLPECALDQVLARVEQMRLAVAAVSDGEDGLGIPVSASFGVATVANSGYELRQLMSDADDALYQAKREGRNRVSLSDNRHMQMSLV